MHEVKLVINIENLVKKKTLFMWQKKSDCADQQLQL